MSTYKNVFLALLGPLFLLILGCGDNKKSQTETDSLPEDSTAIKVEVMKDNTKAFVETDTYFKATGTEPFWSLELMNNKIVFKTPTDSIITPSTKPVKAMDANVSRYTINTESANLVIQIKQGSCTNAMSGEAFPYQVTVEYKSTKEKEFTKVNGCGTYVTDYRLNDIWSLSTINSEKVTTDDFANEFPYLEINTTQNTFLGYAGCNRMNGTVFFENNILRFTNIVTTKMACAEGNKEDEFLRALRGVTTYSIGENGLYLSNPSGVELTFKKVD